MNLNHAYIAGYTDGDGCFFIRRLTEKKFISSFIISSTNPEVLEHFRNLFGGKVRFVRKVENQKAQYHFIMNGKQAYEFCKRFSEFLIEKKEEQKLFSWFHECQCKQEKILLIKDMEETRKIGKAIPSHKFDIENLSNTIQPNEINFAYLAGFIDAECSLGLSRYKQKGRENFIYKNILQCNNTRFQTLKWCVERFGGQIHFIERKKYGEQHSDQLTWRLSSKALNDILPRIFPYLITKKKVCEELIKFSKTVVTLDKNISRNSKKFQEFYAPILVERNLIYEIIHVLNRKGS